MKLKKIFLQNFKGIGDLRIVDLEDSNLSILNGPNGFGKTTIFDAIELCLSGKLERTMQFSYVQKNNQNYRKPFYQNRSGEDVLLKLLFLDSNNKPHVIIKRLDKDHNGKIGTSKAFRPDSWDILETRYASTIDNFNIPDLSNSVLIEQQKVDQLFSYSSGISHRQLYPLFNYLQQEENIYFLKKDEEEKKSQLNFLFQTQQEATEIEKLVQLSRGIRQIQEALTERIRQLGEATASQPRPDYIKMLEGQQSFDVEEPFAAHNAATLNEAYLALRTDVIRLEEFVSVFDNQEYKKFKLREAISYIADNRNYQVAFLLQRFFADDEFLNLQMLNVKLTQYRKLAETILADTFNDAELLDLGFDQTFIDDYRRSVQARDRMADAIGEVGKAVSELMEARRQTLNFSIKVSPDIHDPAKCPLCDTDWNSLVAFQNAFEQKTERLIGINRTQLELLDQQNQSIFQLFREPVVNALDLFLGQEESQLDQAFYLSVTQHRGFKDPIGRFNAILSLNQLSFDSLILQTTTTEANLNNQVTLFSEALALQLSAIVPDQSKLVHQHLFRDYFQEDEARLVSLQTIQEKLNYLQFKYNESRLFSLNILTERLGKFRQLDGQITGMRNGISQAVKTFKLSMVEKIKIPFYLYSGKILQNYQQGLGIFLEMQESTNRVKFLTDIGTDHDIIHHLSSGQLAVVSIAFCLSLNKVYATTDSFKFLAIDDPVQTLDDINIHSFIELMRHDFGDYQIIMSTHEDDIADYLSYKFKKFGFSTQKLKVQQLFHAGI